MKRITVTFSLLLVFFSLLNAAKYTNALIKETSPYLLQHAHNPIEWHSFSPEVFKQALRENKAVFISIGYATCHWCHVMQKESFENEKIAKLLNDDFISVKIDREELSHIDSYYQNIYLKREGKYGGWPLNIFLTPQKEVFYMSGYIPAVTVGKKKSFRQLLKELKTLFHDKKALQKAIAFYKKQPTKKERIKESMDVSFIKSIVNSLFKEYNIESHSFGKNQAFAQVAKVELLYDIAYFTKQKRLLAYYYELLDAMAMRGLYDHVEGGFFRYTVDSEWEIPHFEKMLYTQAEMISLYTNAFLRSKKSLYQSVVIESIAMVEKYFKTKEGLFYSASDAQSDDKEGAYYTFTQEEVETALKNNPYKEVIKEALGFALFGNFHNHIHINFETTQRPLGFKMFVQELKKLRNSRTFPFVDTKVNTAWNAMMVEALYRASAIDTHYIDKAETSLNALLNALYKKGVLYHQRVLPYLPKQKALLEDYAYLIGALLAGYEATYEKKKLLFAEYLFLEAKRKFYDKGQWFLSQKRQIKADSNDKYYTSAQGKMLQNLALLSAIKENLQYDKLLKESLQKQEDIIFQKKSNAPALVRLVVMRQKGIILIKSSLSNLLKIKNKIASLKYPYIITKEEAYQAYLACTLRVCFVKDDDFSVVEKKIMHYAENF